MVGAEPWYRTFFDAEYLRRYAPGLSPERTDREAEGIAALLELRSGSEVLDLCCGHGRHAVALARRGCRVVGQDLCAPFLRQAAEEAARAGVEVEWVEGDMRAIPFAARFDAVINVFTAWGYLESDAEDQKVLAAVRRALKPGGRFLLEVIHRDGLLPRYRPHTIDRFEDGTVVLSEGRLDLLTSRHHVRVTTLLPDGRRLEREHTVRLYTLAEIARMLAEVGLEVTGFHGGLDGSPLTLESRRLVVLARR